MTTVIDGDSATVTLAKVTDAVYLDQAVEEVFGLMLGVSVETVEEEPKLESETTTMTAMVGLAGAVSGTCAILVRLQARSIWQAAWREWS